MKFKKRPVYSFPKKNLNPMTIVAIVSGIAVGAAIGALFATGEGRMMKKKIFDSAGNLINQLTGNTPAKAKAKLGGLIADVSSHIKQNASSLQTATN